MLTFTPSDFQVTAFRTRTILPSHNA